MERARIPGLEPGQRHPDWQRIYHSAIESSLPWHLPELDSDIKMEIEALRPAPQRVIEVGCGLGNQAHYLSRMGLEVTATDISVPAIERAQRTYPHVRFLVDDITRSAVKETFEVAIDRGCFHVLPADRQKEYVANLHRLLRPRAFLFLKVLSSEDGQLDFGPERFSLFGLRRIFVSHFEICRIRRSLYQGSTPHAPKAWFACLRRKERPC